MITTRLRLALFAFLFAALGIVIRLFYWQVLSRNTLAAMADSQHLNLVEIAARRGKIISSDGFDLVGNKQAYLVYGYLPDIDSDPQEISTNLAPIVAPSIEEVTDEASLSAKQVKQISKQLIKDTQATLSARLTNPNAIWTPLARRILKDKKAEIEKLNYKGIGFEPEQIRSYPEASMAAHLIGFVGKDVNGSPKGYFGLEGYYDLELKGRPGILRQEKDARGKPILVGEYSGFPAKDGRSLKLHLDRSVQQIIEQELEEGVKQYGAKTGEVVIMNPKTGGIVALASSPQYDPRKYYKFDKALYKNPVVANAYEPGSTFKVLVMAAALDTDSVKPDTKCDQCEGPVEIGKYTIKTWNEEYHPNITMTEVIQYSDNVGMVFVGNKIGKEKLYEYLSNFGIGSSTGIDLQEETVPELRPANKWGDVDLATISFGQGIAVTGIQMLEAVGAIANDGVLMQPRVAAEILGEKPVTIAPKSIRRVVSEETAEEMTKMMVNAVDSGEAQWTKLKDYKIAGKTGTAQVAEAGEYNQQKTITSFIGFAPADDPKFVMLVKLREPSTSPWAAETAAPLWMKIAKQLLFYYNVPAGR